MISSSLTIEKINSQQMTVGVIGLGYVGLPLLLEFAKKKFSVIGFDVDPKKIASLNNGKTYIRHISNERIKDAKILGKIVFTGNEIDIREMNAILICVPTPLTPQREPDLSFVVSSCEMISRNLSADQIIVLESTTYPGTTDEVVKPILEKSGLKANKDFILAYSPEREDPNNKEYTTAKIPKLVGCDDPECLKVVRTLYDSIVVKTVPVSSTRTAEATKLVENIYRTVNIALVNELKMLFDKMDIDIWEVINAAATKPFGYHPFYPGPGLGGHCLPIDPFYLSWKAREYDVPTKFIELAGEVNAHMPYYVINKVTTALNERKKPVNGAKILIVGMAYKKDVDDLRESPGLKLMKLMEDKGAKVDYHDPYVPCIHLTREYAEFENRKSVPLESLGKYDCVVIATNHSIFSDGQLFNDAKIIVDSRNMFLKSENNVVRA